MCDIAKVTNSRNLLVVNLDVGDEDGPSISYWTLDYDKYKGKIPSSHIKVINNNSRIWDSDWQFSSVNPLYLYPNDFVEILDIHDWYDYLNDYDIQIKQKNIDESLPQYGPSYGNVPLRLITIAPYNRDPIKYVIPIGTPDDKYIQGNIGVFDTSENEEIKQQLANRLRPYKVNASHHDLLKHYGGFAGYTDIISDETELEIDF